ncbi:MAG: ParB/RepB/Spo0J family partition protein [Patescibacteria group bacterium]|nr:ParB/RepB/Spo0J family partition protein [Patescibacteria group bacterium]
MSQFQNDAIFWVDVEKIRPNPFQPRSEFDEARLKDLAGSIRQYGILQPLVVTRKEEAKEDGLAVYYELIAGERRLRASKLAGLTQVPVIIRTREEEDRVRLELAIIENLQREDLNAIDRARAFDRLQKEFSLTNTQIAEKVGKSREYVSNSIRLLALPNEMQQAVVNGALYEGHARALLMLADRPDEQRTVFREVLVKKLSVRQVEELTRQIAVERARKKEPQRPEIEMLQRAFAESLGTKVEIKEQEQGGKLIIDFFSTEDLEAILAHMASQAAARAGQSVSDEPSTHHTEPTENAVPESSSIPDEDSFSAEQFSV